MTDQASPLFTVIIPAKDRAPYLRHTLRTCMTQDYEPLEVIVSDDGSTDNTREVVEEASRLDPRIRYVTPGAGAGMRDNFEFALRQVKPGFVIALGADDALMPGGIRGMRDTLRDTGMELLAWPAPLFCYPKVVGPNGQLVIFHRRTSKIVESRDFLRRQAKHLHYLSDLESPMFYVKGVASTRLIDQVRNRSADGKFYACPTPDGYSGIVLAGEVSRYAFSGKPFSMYGLSPRSQGLGYLSGDQGAKESSEKFFEDTSGRPMHRELASQPYSPLITLMTVDYLLTAKDLPGWGGEVPPIDYRDVLSNALKELAHGLYAEERVCRELKILNQIAELHGLGSFFRGRVGRTRRFQSKSRFEGSGISGSSLFLDGGTYDLQNIVDASYAAKTMLHLRSATSVSSLLKAAVRSVAYRLRSLRKGGRFPAPSEWAGDGQVAARN